MISVAAHGGNPSTNTTGIDFLANSTQPVSVAGHLRLRYNSGTNQLEQSIAGGAYTAIGGVATLQSSYTAGGAGGGIIGLTASGGPLQLKDNATPLGTHLFDVVDSGGTNHYFTVDAASANAAVLDFDDGSLAATSASGKGRIRYNNSTHVFESSTNNGAYSTLGAVTAPLALAPSTDGTLGLTIQAHSATQSADLMQLLDPSGTAVMKFTPVLSAEGFELQLNANSVSDYLFLNVTSGGGGQYRCLLNSSQILQCGVLRFQFLDAGFSNTFAIIDTNGIKTNNAIIFSDSTTQTTAPVSPLFKNATPVSSVTTGEIDAQVFNMAGNTMSTDGQKVVCNAGFTHAADTNSASYKFYVNGTALATQARTGSGELETNEWNCVRATSSTLRCTGLLSNAGAISTTVSSLTGVTFSGTIVIKTAVLGATTNGDMTSNYLRCEFYP
jgi:hypothetical protein